MPRGGPRASCMALTRALSLWTWRPFPQAGCTPGCWRGRLVPHPWGDPAHLLLTQALVEVEPCPPPKTLPLLTQARLPLALPSSQAQDPGVILGKAPRPRAAGLGSNAQQTVQAGVSVTGPGSVRQEWRDAVLCSGLKLPPQRFP